MAPVLSIAYKSVLKFLKDKVSVFLSIFFLIIFQSLTVILKGDGSVDGHLRIYISYSMSFMIFFLSLICIIISCGSIFDEVDGKQMFLIVTKPVNKWKIIIGHWLGVCFVVGALLLVAVAINFCAINFIFAKEKKNISPEDIKNIESDIFAARKTVVIPTPDFRDEIERESALFKKNNPDQQFNYEQLEKISKEVRQKIFYKIYCVPPRQERKWVFRSINNISGGFVTFRFKYFCSDTPETVGVMGKWSFGDGVESEKVEFILEKTPEVFHNIRVPLSSVNKKGELKVSYQNVGASQITVIFPDKDGLSVLYYSGSFISNYFKGILLIFCQIIFLSAIGVMLSSFLSFPVACLMGLFVYGVGSQSSFFINALKQSPDTVSSLIDLSGAEQQALFGYVHKALGFIIEFIFPRFDLINPVLNLTDGRYIGSDMMFHGLIVLCGIQGVCALVLAGAIFKRKEIAKLIV